MRIFLFLFLALLAAPLGVLTFELLDIFVRPDRLAPIFGLDARFDQHVRLGMTAIVPTVLMLCLWILLTRSARRPAAQPRLRDNDGEARLIRAERDYWRDTVARLLAAQQVSDQDRELLLETIRTTLDDHQQKTVSDAAKRALVAER